MKDVDRDAHSTSSNERKLAVVSRDLVDGKAATGEKEFVRDVYKKRHCNALDFGTEHNPAVETGSFKACELPDGSIITVGAEHLHCTEVLLQPSLLDKGASGYEVRHRHAQQFVIRCRCVQAVAHVCRSHRWHGRSRRIAPSTLATGSQVAP